MTALARAGRALGAVLVTAAVAVAAVTGTAVAYWTTTDSANPGAALAETLPTGATPTATLSATTATVTFAAAATSAASGQVALTSYAIKRYAATGAAVASSTCTPTISAGVATCTVSGLPGGSWWFTDTPLLASWVGGESARTANPVNVQVQGTLTFSSAQVSAASPTLTGGVLSGLAANSAVTFHLDSSAGTTLSVVGAPVVTGATGGASGFAVNPGATQGAHTVFAVDAVGNWATFAYTEDTVAPTTTDNTASIGTGWTRTAQTVTLGATDATSGVATTYFTTDGSTPTTASSVYATGVTLAGDGTYVVRYFSVDRFGNTEAVKSSGTVKIDRTAPTVSTVAVGPVAVLTSGFVGGSAFAYANATDAASGVATITADLHLVDGVAGDTAVAMSAAGGPWTVGGVSYAYRSAAFTVAAALTTGITKTFTVTATDVAGNVSAPASGSVAVDKTAPTATDNAPTGWQRAAVTVTITPSDTGGSGVFATYFTTDGTTPSPTSGTAGTSVVLSADGTYSLAYVVYDRAGNASAVVRKTVQIDRTAPVITALAIGPTATGKVGYVSAGVGATVYAAVSDATSGVATVTATLQAGLGTTSTATLSQLATPVTIGTTTYNYSGTFTTSSTLTGTAYTFTVTSTDVAGNSASSSGTVNTSDTTAPAGLAITTPARNGTYAGTFAGTAGNDPSGSGDLTVGSIIVTDRSGHTVFQSLSVSIVGGVWSITGPQALATGPYTVMFTQSDGAGNTTTVQSNFQV